MKQRIYITIGVLLLAAYAGVICWFSVTPMNPASPMPSALEYVREARAEDFLSEQPWSPIPNADTTKSYVRPIPNRQSEWYVFPHL